MRDNTNSFLGSILISISIWVTLFEIFIKNAEVSTKHGEWIKYNYIFGTYI